MIDTLITGRFHTINFIKLVHLIINYWFLVYHIKILINPVPQFSLELTRISHIICFVSLLEKSKTKGVAIIVCELILESDSTLFACKVVNDLGKAKKAKLDIHC